MTKGVWTSPWHYETADYQGNRVVVDITFNVITLALTAPGLSGTRDVGCVYDRVVIHPSSPDQTVFLIPEGSFNVTKNRLNQVGFNLITDILNGGFTLGTSETPTP